MSNMARHHEAEEFGKDEGLIHEAVVTGRKVGAGKGFWSTLAHDQKLFAEVVRFVGRRMEDDSLDAHGGIRADHCPLCRYPLRYLKTCTHCLSCAHAQGKHCAECTNCYYRRWCGDLSDCIS